MNRTWCLMVKIKWIDGNAQWEKKDQLLVNIQCCPNYYSQPKTRNTKSMLKSHTIIAKRLKNTFQPADPIILSETPQIPALSGAHLLNGLNLIYQWLILSFELLISLIKDEILPETPQIPALSGEHLRDGLNLIFQWLILSF
jgi:hypothetical protein